MMQTDVSFGCFFLVEHPLSGGGKMKFDDLDTDYDDFDDEYEDDTDEVFGVTDDE
jgi:hypothetical protein